MVLFRNMYRTNGYVEWRSSLFTKHWDVFSLVFLFINLQLTSSISYTSLSCLTQYVFMHIKADYVQVELDTIWSNFTSVLWKVCSSTKNRHSGLLMAIWIKLICIKKIMIEISVFQIIIQMHGEYWNATTNDCKILDRDRQFI